jgi:hypothetical protein
LNTGRAPAASMDSSCFKTRAPLHRPGS